MDNRIALMTVTLALIAMSLLSENKNKQQLNQNPQCNDNNCAKNSHSNTESMQRGSGKTNSNVNYVTPVQKHINHVAALQKYDSHTHTVANMKCANEVGSFNECLLRTLPQVKRC